MLLSFMLLMCLQPLSAAGGVAASEVGGNNTDLFLLLVGGFTLLVSYTTQTQRADKYFKSDPL